MAGRRQKRLGMRSAAWLRLLAGWSAGASAHILLTLPNVSTAKAAHKGKIGQPTKGE